MHTFYSLWKKVVIFTISFMMVNINFQIDQQQIAQNNSFVSVQFNLAYAAEEKGESKTIQLDTEGGFMDSSAGQTINAIILLAAGYFIMGLYIAFTPSKPMDVTAGAIAGVIYIAAELYEMSSSNKSMSEMEKSFSYTTRNEEGNIDDTQYAAIEQEKKAWEEISSTLETKSTIQMAAGAAWLVAAGLAVMEATGRKGTMARCLAAAHSHVGSLTAFSEGYATHMTFADTTAGEVVIGTAEGLVIAAASAAATMGGTLPMKMTCKAAVGSTETEAATIAGASTGGTKAAVALGKGAVACETEIPILVKQMEAFLLTPQKSTLDQSKFTGYHTEFATLLENCTTEMSAGIKGMSTGLLSLDELVIAQQTTAVTCVPAIPLVTPAIGAYASATVAVKELAVATDTTSATLHESCTEYLGLKIETEGSQFSLFSSVDKKEQFELPALLKMLIPTAYAANSTAMYAGLLGAIAGYQFPVAKALDTFIYSPDKRAILWAGLGAFAGVVSMSTKKSKETADENVAKLKLMLKKMNTSRGVISTNDVNIGDGNLGIDGTTGNLALMSEPVNLGEPMPCLLRDQLVDKQTGVRSCPPIVSTGNLAGGGIDLSKMELGALNDVTSLGNSIQGKSSISPKAMATISNLGSQNNALKKILNKRFKKLDKMNELFSNGKKPVSMERRVANFTKSLNKLGKGSGGFSGSLANARPGDLSAGEKDKTSVAALSKMKLPSFGGEAKKKTKKNGFGFNFTGNVEEAVEKRNAEFAENENLVNESLQEGEENQGDVVQDKNLNIFKVISNRYFKSGYNRLLEEL